MALPRYVGSVSDLLHKVRRRMLLPHSVPTFHEIEKAEWKFYIDVVDPGMTVFDVGANIGELTLLFSHFAGDNGTVHAFEPSFFTWSRLREACASRSNVIVRHLAVAAEPGTANLNVYDEKHGSWNTLAHRSLFDQGVEVNPMRAERVQVTTIDDYCLAHSISVVHLLKIDVEGAEFQVLLGAEQMLREKRIACCTFEYGGTTFDMGNKPEKIRAYLSDCGYALTPLAGDGPLFPGIHNAREAEFSMLVARPA